jgi:single-stranded DNA-binding protein
MNVVAIIGNVASEPDLTKHPQLDHPICTFRIAVGRADDDQAADFFEVVTQERQAVFCDDYLTIGRRVAIEGRLRTRVVVGEAPACCSVELVAWRVQLLGAGRHAAPAVGELVEVAR